MSTEWLPVDHPDAPRRAAEALSIGILVVLPTDTVYGVAADLWNEEAVAALYAAKGRPPDKAIPLLLADAEHALHVAADFSAMAHALAEAFWPGPLTLAVPKQPDLPAIVSALPTVGLRVPDHGGTRRVIRAAGGALAVTSANRSNAADSLMAREAAEALGGAVGLVLDGGSCPGGQPSTVVDVSHDELRIVREGPLSEDDLREALERTLR